MGISADLILFDEDGDLSQDDLSELETLFEFFPVQLHHLIKEQEVEIYDMDSYKELFGNDIKISIIYPNGNIMLNNDTYISEPMTTFTKCNVIKYKSLGYLGGKEVFKKNIFRSYNERSSYPYLWRLDEIDHIISNKELKKGLEVKQ